MKVDILIPSKDRACQLHLLLAQLSKNAKGIGRVVITIQTSAEEFAEGYSILKKRVANDDIFQNLRKNAEIVYHERDSLAGVIGALEHLGESDYVMLLVDDETFHKQYDLENDPASQYLFDHPSVLACAIRLGKNITPEPFRGKKKSLLRKTQPEFIRDDDFLVWYWPENLIQYHWSSISSITGHIYRKENFINWFYTYGRENFLNIEGDARRLFLENIFRVPCLVNNLIYWLDWGQQIFFDRVFNIRSGDVLRYFFSRRLFKFSTFRNDEIPFLMVAPKESVTASLDYFSHQEGLKHIKAIVSPEYFNQQYLEGKVISEDWIESIRADESLISARQTLGEIRFEKYSEEKENQQVHLS